MRSKLLIVVVIVMQLGCQKETIINSTIYIDVEVSSAGIDSIPHHLTIDEIKRLNVEVQKKYIVNPYRIVSINTNKIDAIYLPITFKELRLISDKIKKSKGPVVGRLNTIAVIVAPEMILGRIQPIVLTIGLIATRRGYLNKRVLSFTPLARTVTTYCFFNSSSSVPRMTRISPAVPAVPMTMMGMGRCLSRSMNLPMLQEARRYSGEKSPPTLILKNL